MGLGIAIEDTAIKMVSKNLIPYQETKSTMVY